MGYRTTVERPLEMDGAPPYNGAADYPPTVQRIAPSNTPIKRTAKLKSQQLSHFLAAYPPLE